MYLFICFSNLNVLVLFLHANSKCDINSSQDLQWSDFSYGNGSSTLTFILVLYALCWRYFLYANFFCCAINFISSSYMFNFLYCINALCLPKLSIAACNFVHSKIILLLSGISCTFCWNVCLYCHRILSSLLTYSMEQSPSWEVNCFCS